MEMSRGGGGPTCRHLDLEDLASRDGHGVTEAEKLVHGEVA